MGWPGRDLFWIRLIDAPPILITARVNKEVSTHEHDQHLCFHDVGVSPLSLP